MGVVYSYDLRLRIMDYVDSGVRPEDLSKLFSVHERTIYSWMQKREFCGNFKPSEKRRRRSDRKIKDLGEFRKFVDKNPSRTAKEMASDYGGVTAPIILRALNEIGYTSKKNKRGLQRKQRRGQKSV